MTGRRLLWLWLCTAFACSGTPPPGKVSCRNDSECPQPVRFCHLTAPDAGLCYDLAEPGMRAASDASFAPSAPADPVTGGTITPARASAMTAQGRGSVSAWLSSGGGVIHQGATARRAAWTLGAGLESAGGTSAGSTRKLQLGLIGASTSQ